MTGKLLKLRLAYPAQIAREPAMLKTLSERIRALAKPTEPVAEPRPRHLSPLLRDLIEAQITDALDRKKHQAQPSGTGGGAG